MIKIVIFHLFTFVFLLASSPKLDMNNTQDSNHSTALISLAKSKLGSPYVYAKSGPDSFDCSGFVYYLFQTQKIAIPRTSLAQSEIGEKLPKEALKKGDLLFFDTANRGHVNHSGVYLGKQQFIHASSGKAKAVTISDLNGWYKDKFLWGIRKIP